MSKQIFQVEGMDCDSCAKMIELDLEDEGITAKCSYSAKTLEIDGDADINKIKSIVEKSGYSISK